MIAIGHVKRHAGVYVGRPQSPLGNPASHRESRFAQVAVATLEEALAWYEPWLEACLADPHSEQSLELARLRALELEHGKLTLLCWCSRELREPTWPPTCHADIIALKMRTLH